MTEQSLDRWVSGLDFEFWSTGQPQGGARPVPGAMGQG